MSYDCGNCGVRRLRGYEKHNRPRCLRGLPAYRRQYGWRRAAAADVISRDRCSLAAACWLTRIHLA